MNCLNCNSETTGSFCYNCGQKTSTSRFSFKEIFKNDIANQYYSFIKSPIFFTLKELATRPGHSIREYLLGKRVTHMNYMSLYLLLTGAGIFLDKYAKVSTATIASTNSADTKILAQYFDYLKENPKTYIFITIPIISIFTFLFYKKSKFYFSEHIIMNIYKASALLVITKITVLFSTVITNIAFLKIMNQTAGIFIAIYSFWFLYQFFNDPKLYSKIGIITRTFFSVFLGIVISTLFIFIYWLVIFALTKGKL